jgi:hypothetical protein
VARPSRAEQAGAKIGDVVIGADNLEVRSNTALYAAINRALPEGTLTLHTIRGVSDQSYGSNSKVGMWAGRTTVKWRRSRVAIWLSWSLSAAATTEASTVPSGRSR